MRDNSLVQKVALAGLLLALFLGCQGNTGHGVGAAGKEGVKAPDFLLRNLDGEMVRLSDYTGKVVVLNFWATWCAPCRIEIPFLIDLYSRYRSRQVAVIGITLDPVGVDALKGFADEMGINYPLLVGDDKVSSDYGGIFGVPTTFLINQEGRIVNRHVGLAEEAVLEREILALLGK